MQVSLTSEQLNSIVPRIGVINAESPSAVVMLDAPDMEVGRQLSQLILSIQTGQRPLAGAPVYYADRNLKVQVLIGKERVLVNVFPQRQRGHLTDAFVWSGWSDRMGWDLFRIYFGRSRQYILSPSVGEEIPQEFPSLVKYEIAETDAKGR